MNDDVITVANGKWPGLLMELGVPEQAVSGKHSACPMCGGKDRFRMVELDGKAWWICNQCGSGDGMDLAMAVTRTNFKEMAEKVRSMAGFVTSQPAPKGNSKKDAEKIRQQHAQLWREAKDQDQSLLAEYMAWRCIPEEVWKKADLRLHNEVGYWDDEGKFSSFMPCMLARVVTASGRLAGLHRTYLHRNKDGSFQRKKKLTKMAVPMSGGAIRLMATKNSRHMGVAEGIESALSLSVLHKTPVWATISANNMERVALPEHVGYVLVAGDEDSNFTGQKAAYTLANRLTVHDKKQVRVICEWTGGTDANDKLRNG